jgi:hypothetical protein
MLQSVLNSVQAYFVLPKVFHRYFLMFSCPKLRQDPELIVSLLLMSVKSVFALPLHVSPTITTTATSE